MATDGKNLTAQALALLNNAKRLCVYREQRPLARDVIRACKLLVAGTQLDPITPALDELELAIPGKMRDELIAMFYKAKTIILGTASEER